MGSRPVWPGCISIKTCVCLLTQVLRCSAPFTGIHNGVFMAHSFLQELKQTASLASGTPWLKGASSPQPGAGFQGSAPQPEQVQPSLGCWNKGLDIQTCSCVGCFPSGTFSNIRCIKGACDTRSSYNHWAQSLPWRPSLAWPLLICWYNRRALSLSPLAKATSVDPFQRNTGEGKPPFHTALSFGLILFVSPGQPTIIAQHVGLWWSYF